MVIKYQFVNEVVSIEVSEEWGKILASHDRRERNNNQTETRRHTSLDGMAYEGEFFSDTRDMAYQVEISLEIQKAFDSLLPQQKDLFIKVYFEGFSITEIARKEGVYASSIHKRLQRIYDQIKKFLQ